MQHTNNRNSKINLSLLSAAALWLVFSFSSSVIANESGPDRDGDGVPNHQDIDDDNDGIPDVDEGAIDADNDGTPDAGSRDSDGDGIPDSWDLDSDNDGLMDLYESQSDKQFPESADGAVPDGVIDQNYEVGSNGLLDIYESSPDSGGLVFEVVDTDGDGLPDYLDTDSDGDSIPDLAEGGGGDADCDGRADKFTDADGNGVSDHVGASGYPLYDTDADGISDFRDLDSDSDGYSDRDEAGANPCDPVDSDGNGVDDYQQWNTDANTTPESNTPDSPDSPTPESPSDSDFDNDGVPDSMDMDDDNDGLLDDLEGKEDSDQDSHSNYHDLDSDNDGVFDAQEAAALLEIIGTLDLNNDGQLNEAEVGTNGYADDLETSPDSGVPVFPVADTDGDGVPDFIDLDSDNDSILDTIESNHEDLNNDGRMETTVNELGLAIGSGGEQLDWDGDSVVDRRDLDSDNDGLPDLIEARGVDLDGDGRIDGFIDNNFDGLDDGVANAAPGAIDTDGDRVFDFRDLDSDQDSLSDLLETRGPSFDLDNDGVLDNYTDANGDGYDDYAASQPLELMDLDRDGLPNQVDIDSDNDGLTDLEEVGGVDEDGNGTVDDMADSDGDGIPDDADVDQAGGSDSDGDGITDAADADNNNGPDTDGDGIIDEFDPDSDGDGMAGPNDDGTGQGTPQPLPDDDVNGVPDFQDADGLVATGTNGCQIGSGSHSDISFVLLVLAVVGMMIRRQRKRVLYATRKIW